ncbi:D-isomer specific 2-hydroxyacid dehydrogenase family protein [Janthinobacterium agaricidamnosum]|uniref:D-isomer specific 2-hydroxyacid dehydrogenase, NAD binding domain protein n=1 Tax=Janthinobacterium agaricidamnosum NBRC 102515 = DSM 9628 TaxID=1349767 RepID=W0V0J6_9BURK|nr:D-isomer specific 2-hydroxyacid dehydrogenase family protein [Janthinobacterium agaricidamnosum]CDG82354.1 D-isomer specific 2-hydroxyacid dehydrogenase, NAD binding domain protein [Janthinobacterium agaricidamnosum NBRC 102515 = DSM 9628]
MSNSHQAPTIASQFAPNINALLAAQAGLQVLDLAPGPLTALPDADVLFVLPAPKGQTLLQTPAPLQWPSRVRWVQLASVGIDYYPPWLFQGPVVTSARGTASDAIAEYVLAAIFSAAKKIPQIWLDQNSQWQRPLLGLLKGSTLGLYGFGSIGQALAQRALALGIKVIALRRSDTPFEVAGVEAVADLAELLSRSDHLVLAAPSTSATRHVINRAALAHAKPGLHLINVARGNLIDHAALHEALDAWQVSLATLDVTDPEPLPAGHAFYSHPQVRLSPHISPSTEHIVPALIDKFLHNLIRFRSGAPLIDVVDTARGY